LQEKFAERYGSAATAEHERGDRKHDHHDGSRRKTPSTRIHFPTILARLLAV
jgi:hypothetical protein